MRKHLFRKLSISESLGDFKSPCHCFAGFIDGVASARILVPCLTTVETQVRILTIVVLPLSERIDSVEGACGEKIKFTVPNRYSGTWDATWVKPWLLQMENCMVHHAKHRQAPLPSDRQKVSYAGGQ